MPWQEHVACVATEYEPGEGFLYDEVDLTVPRQSGKTTMVRAKTVHRLVVMARTHGPQMSTYTAQKRQAARKKLELDFAVALRRSRAFREVRNAKARPTKPTEFRLSLNNGMEHIQFGNDSFWFIGTPSRDGGHGDTLDDATIDEAFAHHDDEVEGALRPAQATRPDAQIWVLSTAGDEHSRYLWRKVRAGRAACAAGTPSRVAYFEWSAPDDADYADPDVWYACSPALGYTIDEAFLHAEWDRLSRLGQDGIDTFRRGYLNQWPVVPILEADDETGPMSRTDWSQCGGEHEVNPDQPLAVAFDVAADRSWSSISISDGETVEISHNERGTGWIIPTLLGIRDRRQPVDIGYPPGPAASLHQEALAAGLDIRALTGPEFRQACGAFIDAVNNGRLRHRNQNELTTAALNTAVRLNDGGEIFSRSASIVDISPLTAATAARWLAIEHRTEAPPKPTFAY